VVAAPQLLGGFAAGLALSRRFFLPFGAAIRTDEHFAHQIETQMKPIVQLFTPIFFVMVGLALNLREVVWGSSFIWAFSLSLLASAILGKVVGAFVIAGPWRNRLTVGLAIVPRGEVGLVFPELGRTSGILDTQIYAGVIIVIALTTLGPPFLLQWLHAPVKRGTVP